MYIGTDANPSVCWWCHGVNLLRRKLTVMNQRVFQFATKGQCIKGKLDYFKHKRFFNCHVLALFFCYAVQCHLVAKTNVRLAHLGHSRHFGQKSSAGSVPVCPELNLPPQVACQMFRKCLVEKFALQNFGKLFRAVCQLVWAAPILIS